MQTAYGSLTIGLDLQRGQSLLIRGGTASVGLAAAAIAKDLGATVLSTTRQPDRADALKAHGVDYPLVDAGQVAPLARELYPEGVDAALELVGTPTLPDTLASTASTAPSASPACSRISGSCRTSIRSPTCLEVYG